jgi:TP901 family phage tail tape measure protein
MILKAKVVKLKVELDYKNSKLPKQVQDITKFLENKPVKLKVKLDGSIGELNKQLGTLSKTLQNSKSFKPLKIGVSIDVAGSAKTIKKDLRDIYDTVEDFNRKYGEQLRRMKQQTDKFNQTKGNVPMDAGVQNFNNIKRYTEQLKQAEQQLRSKFSDGKGLFSTAEMKDAQGNLRGFISSLERANGVVEKIRYEWNSEKNKFQVMDRQTVTNTEKNIQRAMQALENLQREIDKTGDESKQFQREYNALLREGKNGTLGMDAVKDLQTRLRNEQAIIQATKKENALLREQEKLVAEIVRERNKVKGNAQVSGDLTGLKNQLNSMKMSDFKDPNSANMLAEIKRQFNEVKQSYNDQIKKEKELINVQEKRKDIMSELRQISKTTDTRGGVLGGLNITEVKRLASTIRTMEDYIAVKRRMDEINRARKEIAINDKASAQLDKLRKAMLDWATATGKSVPAVEKRFDQLKRNMGSNLAQLTNETRKYVNQLNNFKLDMSLVREANSLVKDVSHVRVAKMVERNDVEGLKEYIGQLNKAKVSMLKLEEGANGVKRIRVQFESTGKTAKQLTYQIDDVTKKLRHLNSGETFNRNANLGIFEQLRVAMARVPVWMTAMTAFYGTIGSVRAMSNEILKLDSAMTELRRVASDSLNIESVFDGSVQMSKELGNNVHDVLGAVNELSRTFGDFNERQLLAITRTAVLMSNVSDLKVQEASDTLVGTMNAFNISAEESIHIVDALNEVDNDYAISTAQLATGLSKSASTAKTFGVSMEESVGHITAIGAVTMESGNIIGNSLKTIYSRITTLDKSQAVLQDVGVRLYDIGENGKEIRPVNDILEDLGKRWLRLSDEQRQNIGVQVAGRYQLSRFLALMNNWNMALQATNTATYSQGSAMRENAQRMKSFEARINTLKNSFTDLSRAVGDAVLSDGMMSVIRGLTELAGVAIKVVDTFGALPIALGAVSAVLLKMGVFEKVKDGIVSGLTAMQGAYTSTATRANVFATTMARSSAMAGAGFGAMRTQAVTALSAMGVAVKGFAVTFKAMLASTLIGGAFVALGIAIEKIMKLYNEKKQKEEELVKMNKKMVDSYRQSEDGLQGLAKKYEDLSNITNRTTEQQSELDGVTKSLAERLPTTVQFIDANGKAHLKSSEQIKKEIEAVKELSRQQAKLEQAKFAQKMEKQAQSFDNITEKIKKLNDEQKKLYENDGKSSLFAGLNDDVSGGKIDNKKAIEQNKLEILMAESEKTKAIQSTIKTIQEQTLAYFEANKQLGMLGEEQQKAIENFIGYNEAMLRNAKTPEQFKKSYQELFELGKDVGDVYVEAYKKMADGIDRNRHPEQLNEVKKSLNDIAKQVPQSFYTVTNSMGKVKKSSGEVQTGLKEIINVSNRVDAGDKNFKSLQKRLEKTGLSAEDAGYMLLNMGQQYGNTAIESEGFAQGLGEANAEMDSLNEKAMEAIDLLGDLFDVNKEQLAGIKSHIQAMELQVDIQGEGAKKSEKYLEHQKQIVDFLGISTTEYQKNKDEIFKTIEALETLDLSTYTTSDSFEGFVNKSEDLTDAQKNLLIEWSKTKGAKDILTGAHKDIQKSTEDTNKKLTEAQLKNAETFPNARVDKKDNGAVQNMKDIQDEGNKTNKWMTGFKKVMATAFRGLFPTMSFSFSGLANRGRNSLYQELGSLGGDIGKWFADIGKKTGGWLKAGFGGIGDYFGRFLTPKVKESLSGIGKSISDFFGGMGKKSKDGAKNMGQGFDDWVKKDGSVQRKIIDGTVKWTGIIVDWFKKLPSDIANSTKNMGAGIGDFFKDLPEKSAPSLERFYFATLDFFKGLPSKLSEGFQAVVNWVKGIPSYLAQGWDSVVEWFKGIPQRIVDGFTVWKENPLVGWIDSKREGISTAFEGWWVEISAWLVALPARIKAKIAEWGNLLEGFVESQNEENKRVYGEWLNNILGFFGGLPEKIGTELSKMGGTLSSFFTGKVPEIALGIATWWKPINDWFVGLIPKTFTAVSTWFSSFLTQLKGNASMIGGVMSEWWTPIGKWFSDLIPKSTEKLKTWWSSVWTSVTSNASNWATALGTWGTAIGNWFAGLPSATKGKFDAWLGNIGTWFSNGKETWSKRLSEWSTSVSSWFTNLPSKTKTGFDTWVNSISTWFSNAKERWSKRLSEWGTTISSWFTNLPSKTKTGFDSWVNSFGTWFNNTKKNWSANLDKWWGTIKGWFTGLGKRKEIEKSGSDMIDAVGKGIVKKKPAQLEKLSETILDTAEKVGAMALVLLLALGREMIERLITGIGKTVGALYNTWNKIKAWVIKTLANLAIDAFKKGKEILGKLVDGVASLISRWGKKWDEIKASAIKKMEEMIKSVVKMAKSLPEKIGDAISGAKEGATKGIKSLANFISDLVEKGLNKVIVGGINKVLDKMGVDEGKQLKDFKLPHFAKGTPNGKKHKGGHALVGEEGRELAYIPNKGVTMLGQRGAEIRNLPKNTSVLPNKETEQILTKYGFPAYKSGVGDFFADVGDAFTDPKKLLTKTWEKMGLNFNLPKGLYADVTMAGVSKVKDAGVDYVKNAYDEFMSMFDWGGGDSVPVGAGSGKGGMHPFVEKWYNQVKDRFGKTRFMGGYNNRNMVGGNSKSMHAYGRAFDIGGSKETMGQIAEWLRKNATNVQYVIYNHRSSKNGGAWKPYGGAGKNPHTDHVHADFYPPKGSGNNAKGAGQSAQAWKPKIIQASKQMHEDMTGGQLKGIIAQIHRESKGNEKITQSSSLRDINVLAGNPARGLLQYIPQTFRTYAMRGHTNIYSGYDQLLAWFNNTNWRKDLPYGHSGWGPTGHRKYAKGGLIDKPHFGLVGEAGREYIIPVQNNRKEGLELWQQAGRELGVRPYAKGGAVGKPKLTYTAREGNTLSGIAKIFKTSVETLKKLNSGLAKLNKDSKLKEGQKVNVTGIIKDDDSFNSNSLLDPNRKKKGYVQAEDGSWVTSSTYKDPSYKASQKAGKPVSTTKKTSSSVLKRGSKGEDVKTLQKKLGIKADGIYGAQTEKAVKAYQKKNGLSADGIVGAKTMSKMGMTSSKGSSSKTPTKTTTPAPTKALTPVQILGSTPEQKIKDVTNSMSLLEAQMADLDKTSLKYRDSTKKLAEYQVQLLALQKLDLSTTQKRQTEIEKKMGAMGDPKKLSEEKREEYNTLKDEYANNADKIANLKSTIEQTYDAIDDKLLEIFTSYISEITTKYDQYLKGFTDRIDDVEFKMNVQAITDPDNKKALLNNQIDKANLSKEAQATAYNKKNSMEIQHTNAVKKYGYHSEQAKAVRAELEQAREAYEEYTLAVLNAEKEIKDTRGAIADEAIAQLKGYYGKVKEMATSAIDKQKEAMQKAHDDEMKLYDEKVNKINAVYDAEMSKRDKKKSEDDYQKELDKKNAKKAELSNKIALLSRNGSASDKKKVADLQKELDDVNEEILDFTTARQDDLFKQDMDAQKNKQILDITGGYDENGNLVVGEKEKKQEAHDKAMEELDKEKEAISKKYDDMINDEKKWADMRNEATKGNFATINTELTNMSTNLNNMNKGIFDGLTAGFKGYAEEAKKEIAEMFGLDIDNMIYGSKEPISDVKEAQGAKKYDANSDGTVKTRGKKVDNPKTTTPPPAKTPDKTPPKTSTPPKGSTGGKTPTTSSQRQTTANLNFRKTAGYGNNIMLTIPKSAKVEFVGMEKGWAKVKYNGKTGYVSNDYLKKFDTGGYTGNWAGNDGKVAMLHKKEQVLNRDDTKNLFSAVKVVEHFKHLLPDFANGSIDGKLATAGNITNNITYGDINVTVEGGDKKKAKDIAKEILTGMKKKGK